MSAHHPRAPRLPLTIRLKLTGSFPDCVGHSINFSHGGLCLRSTGIPDRTAAGTKIVVVGRLPEGGASFRAHTTVVWADPAGRDHLGRPAPVLGLAFDEGHEEELEELRSFIAHFRHHVVALDVPEVRQVRDALGEFFVVRELETEEAVLGELATGQVGLVLLGAPPSGDDGVARLTRLLGNQDLARHPTIVYTSRVVTPAFEDVARHSSRVVYLSSPIDPVELMTLVPLLVEVGVLAYEHEELTAELERALERLSVENVHLRVRASHPSHLEGLIGESTAIRAVVEAVERLAPLTTSVMIIGETGTGKDLVARAIHAHSPRAQRPFVALNCAAVAENLVDAELFGHMRGAFTGATTDRAGLLESGHGGTVFLDEVGEMPLTMQAKLLRTLQSGEIRRIGSTKTVRIDVRILCATNRDLVEMVRERTFREDLYYRLRAFVVPLPPLRERRGDVPLLVFHFIDRASVQHRKPPPGITLEAMRLLEEYPWPGNVRELAYAVEGLVIVCPPEQKIDGVMVRETLGLGSLTAPVGTERSLDDAVADFERQLILAELTRAGGVITQAARALGVDRSTLSKRLKRLGLSIAGLTRGADKATPGE